MNRSAEFQSIYDYILNIPAWNRSKTDLVLIREFLKRMDIPYQKLKVIHVAGTNGKGSFCAYLTRILMDRGYHVGTFTSPHLVDIRERIAVDSQKISEELFAEAYYFVKKKTDEWVADGKNHPVYFEFLFYMAIYIYTKLSPDYVILETGIGGLLDTTTAFDTPILCAITSISYDHMALLGDTIELIAGQKAGIICEGVPVVYLDGCGVSSEVIEKKAAELHAPLYRCSDMQYLYERLSFLAAPYMKQNAMIAARAAHVLGISDDEAILESLKNAYWPCRMDQVAEDVWIDGAHNEDGLRAFADGAYEICMKKGKKPVLLMSSVSDKDLSNMFGYPLDRLKPSRVYVPTINSHRKTEAADLKEIMRKTGSDVDIRIFENSHDALRCALSEKGSDEILFCVGSLYLAGEIYAQF